MVAKAATRAGEFFCFHCGKQVDRDDVTCRGCGLNFHKVIRAFRCPRCAKILPSGAVICPACGLGFKIKNVTSTKPLSKDDEMLVDLIDWGKQPEAPGNAAPSVSISEAAIEESPQETRPEESPTQPERTSVTLDIQEHVEAAHQEEPCQEAIRHEEPSSQEVQPTPTKAAEEPKPSDANALFVRLEEMETDLLKTIDKNKNLINETREQIEVAEEGAIKSTEEVNQLYHRLASGIEDMERLDSKINQLAYEVKISLARMDAARHAAQQAPPPSHGEGRKEGLSNIALKRLLEERENEVLKLREKEAEMARREEHITKLMREYAAKKKELESMKRRSTVSVRDASDSGRSVEDTIHLSDFPGRLDVEDKDGWLKEQARIKDGLIEIRNDMGQKGNGTGYYHGPVSGEVMEKIEVLEERLVDAKRERDELSARLKSSDELMEEIRSMFMVLDQLLSRLPPEVIDEFSKSKDFKLYDKILDKLRI